MYEVLDAFGTGGAGVPYQPYIGEVSLETTGNRAGRVLELVRTYA